jgi:hypothetical protein
MGWNDGEIVEEILPPWLGRLQIERSCHCGQVGRLEELVVC